MTQSLRTPHPGILVLVLAIMLSACTSGEGPASREESTENKADAPRTENLDGTSVAYLSQDAPSFSATGIRGETVTESLLHGRISLVNFWATWCGPCIIETPELVGLHEEWSGRPFQVIGISMDTYADQEVVDFVDNFEVTYPVFIDTMGVADSFGGAFALPTTYLVDGTGTIVRRYIGLFPMKQVRSELDSLVTALEQAQ